MERNLEKAKGAAEAKSRELTELNRDFMAILNYSSDFLYIKDNQFRYRAQNLNHAKLTGFSSWSESRGKTDFDIFPP